MSQNRKQKGSFKKQWGNLTEIGRLFGFSAVKLGSELKALGLRSTDGKPSPEALEQNLATSTPMKGGFEFYMWHKKRLPERLRQAGLKQVGGPSDQAFAVAHEALALVAKGNRLDEQGEDKMARFTYQAAQIEIGEIVKEAPAAKQPHMALRIVQHLTKAGLGVESIKPLMEECGVSWEHIQKEKLSQNLPQVGLPAKPSRF